MGEAYSLGFQQPDMISLTLFRVEAPSLMSVGRSGSQAVTSSMPLV